MKFIVAILALAAVAFAAPQQQQQPIAIVRQASDSSPEGSYSFSYETENGISANENAQIRITGDESADKDVRGSYSYTAPDGTPISLNYVADANGFQPSGAHLPVSPVGPAVPELIARAVDYVLRNANPKYQQ